MLLILLLGIVFASLINITECNQGWMFFSALCLAQAYFLLVNGIQNPLEIPFIVVSQFELMGYFVLFILTELANLFWSAFASN